MADELKPYSGPVTATPGLKPYQGPVSGGTTSAPAGTAPNDPANFPGKGRRDTGTSTPTATELPPPSMTMYDDLGRGFEANRKAIERYNQYRNHPEASTGFLGEVIYRGKVVPPPSMGLTLDPDPSISSVIAGSVRNSIKSGLQTFGAVGDYLDEKIPLGGFQLWNKSGKWDPKLLSPSEMKTARERGETFTSAITENMAELDAGDSTVDKILIEGGSLMMGGIGGLKVADKVVDGIQFLGKTKTVKNLAKVLGFEVGAVSTVSPDAETLLIGDKAMFKGFQEEFPLLKGAPIDASDADYEVILKRRMNMLADAAMLAKPAEATLKGVTWVSRVAWSVTIAPFLKVGSRSAQEEAIAAEILDNLALVGKTDDKASIEAQKRIVQLIRENANVFANTTDDVLKDINMSVDTMTALERALANNNTEEARQIIAKARGMRSGALNSQGGAPQLADRMGAPARAFEDVTTKTEQALGETNTIEGARTRLVESGRADIAKADAAVTDLTGRLRDAETSVVRLIQEDPTFGSRIAQLEQASGINIYAGRNQASEEIVANVRRAFETMDAEKDRLYGAIQGGEVDPKGLIKILGKLRPGQLDAAAGALPANSQFGTLLDVFKKRMKEVTDEAGETTKRMETDEELLKRVTRWMDSNDLDFAKLYREIRPSVSASAENLFTAAAPEAKAAGQVLREFSNWIDNDAVNALIRNGDDDVADAAAAAKEYYVTQYAPFWRDGVLGEVADTYRATVGRTSQAMRNEFGVEIQPLNFNAQTRQRLEGVLSDQNREFGGQVISLLSRPEGGGNAGLVTDYIIGDIVGDIGTRIKAGQTLDQIDLNQIVGRLTEYGALISNNFPDQAARISTFVDNLRNSRGNVANLRTQLEAAEAAALKAKDDIYSNELSAFFKAEGIENPNGYAVFEGILNNKQSENTIAALLQRADDSGSPLIRRGMQAAYARYIRSKFLGATEEIGGNRILKLGPEAAVRDQVTNILQYGDQIFSDNPAFMDATRSLLDIAGVVTRSKGAKAVASDSPTAARTEAIAAVNRTVTAVVGVLSRTGARVRSAATTVINRLSPDQAAFRILDAMYADPEYFAKVADRVISKRTPLDGDVRDLMFSFLVRSNIYTTDDEQDFVMSWAQQEQELERGVNRVVDQTERALGLTPVSPFQR